MSSDVRNPRKRRAFSLSDARARTTADWRITSCASGSTSIIVTMPYTGDTDLNNTARVQWKLCTDAAYPAPPANTINAAHSASPYQVTITGLAASTCYNIQATYLDGAVYGTSPQVLKIASTWDDTLLHNSNRFPLAIALCRKLVVSVT